MSRLASEQTAAVAAAAAARPRGADRGMWTAACGYEHFMGRWSRRVADGVLDELCVPAGPNWLDVGCGVGSLTAAIVERCSPGTVVGIDPSAEFLRVAADRLAGVRGVRFVRGIAEGLPLRDATFDETSSGLALNFVGDPDRALGEMVRVTRPGGRVAVYVWDYGHPDFFLTRFWEAVAEATGQRAADDERGRWKVCSREGLTALAQRSLLVDARVWRLPIMTTFSSPDELWNGFLLGIGPSGSTVASLTPSERESVRCLLQARLPVADGTVPLTASAIAMTGTRRSEPVVR